MAYVVKLNSEENLSKATEWCEEHLECSPHVTSAWMREWRNGDNESKKILFLFTSEHWATQFKLMGF